MSTGEVLPWPRDSGPLYYNHAGEPISLSEWGELFHNRRPVGRTTVHEHLVSTVWIGLNYNYGIGPPLIFETMIFCEHEPKCDLDDEMWRYTTEDEAEAGHDYAIQLVTMRYEL